MTTVVLHKLAGSKKALEACRTVESLYQAGRRVIVWMADEGRAVLLDEYLWTYSTNAFVPHVLSKCDAGHVEAVAFATEPVAIATAAPHNPNRADVLVVLDRLPDLAFASSFVEVHDFIAPGEEDGDKIDAWRAAGFDVREGR